MKHFMNGRSFYYDCVAYNFTVHLELPAGYAISIFLKNKRYVYELLTPVIAFILAVACYQYTLKI